MESAEKEEKQIDGNVEKESQQDTENMYQIARSNRSNNWETIEH